jgi:hypothetical protein
MSDQEALGEMEEIVGALRGHENVYRELLIYLLIF